MSDESPTLEQPVPQAIGPSTPPDTKLQIQTSRRETASRMVTAGATQTDINIEGLISNVNDREADLFSIGLPGEDRAAIITRIQEDEFSQHTSRVIVSNAISARLSLESEQRTKANQAQDFSTEGIDNDLAEVKHAFEVAMSPLIAAEQRKWNCDAATAKANVATDIAARGQARVMPVFDRIFKRFAAKYPEAVAAAEAGQ